jgi:glutamate-1-semialdehyde 2,1-aminomutase
MLTYIREHPEIYDTLEQSAARLTAQVPEGVCVNRVGSMVTFFFQAGPVRNFEEAKRSDTGAFARFFHHLLERGIYFPPSQFEAAFISSTHSSQDIEMTVNAMSEFFVHV